VSVQRASAHAYDPLGDGEEHSDEASRTVDRDDGTAWTTEQYRANIAGAGKPGVGLYIDAKPKVEAVQLQIETPEPGWHTTIYAAPPGSPPDTVPEGWTKVGGGTVNSKDKRFKLDTAGTEFRYYLVWITELPPGAERAQISEIRLFQKVRA
jgi:serine/threonine-protein kinase